MIDLCQLNASICQNNGQCTSNISSNTTYCQCGTCYNGVFCENVVWKQGKYDTTYAFLITSIIGVCFSLLNNGLIFELFICCRQIRITNCGVYLFVYSILSLVSNILIVIDQFVQYYPNSLFEDSYGYGILHCYTIKVGYNALLYCCIWLSACIAFERGLYIWFDTKLYTWWRSCVTIIVMLVIGIGCATLLVVYKCDWNDIPKLQSLRTFFVWFYITAGIAAYVVVTFFVLISFALRIRAYGMERGSFVRTFFSLLKSHFLIFVPSIAYIICTLPYTIVVNTENPAYSYYQCGLSLGEFTVKFILDALQNVPYVLTWLLFVYPSRVYMADFYLNTWSETRSAQIIIACEPYIDRIYNIILSIKNRRNDEHNNVYVPEMSITAENLPLPRRVQN